MPYHPVIRYITPIRVFGFYSLVLFADVIMLLMIRVSKYRPIQMLYGTAVNFIIQLYAVVTNFWKLFIFTE